MVSLTGYHTEKKLLILGGLTGDVLAETCLRGLWDQEEFFQQNRGRTVPVDRTAYRHGLESPVSSTGNQQMVGVKGAPSCRRSQRLVLLRADLTRSSRASRGHLAVTEDISGHHSKEKHLTGPAVCVPAFPPPHTQSCPGPKPMTVMTNSIVPTPVNTGTSLTLVIHIRAQEKK